MTPVLWRAPDGQPIQLAPPELRCRPQPSLTQSAAWTPQGETRWTFTLDALELAVDAAAGRWQFSATARQPLQIGRCAFVLRWAAPQAPWLLDRCYRWGQWRDTVAGAPLVLRWVAANGARVELRGAPIGLVYQANWCAGEITLRLVLDAAALHPRWQFTPQGRRSTAAPVWQAGQTLRLELQLNEAADELATPPAVPARFPGGAEAVFVITDHCDFDTTERLRLFLHGDAQTPGWLGRGLRLTKGVFTLASANNNAAPAATLQDADYRALIETLARDGSEIAPHGLNERGNIAPAAFQQALQGWPWPLRTWIDHGSTLDYCYTMGGAEHPEYRLLDTLRGVRALWAYHDLPADAAGSLNLLAPPSSSVAPLVRAGWRHLRHGRIGVALHYARSLVRWHTDGAVGELLEGVMSALRRLGMHGLWRASEWQRFGRTLARSFRRAWAAEDEQQPLHTRAELLACAAALYPERGVPLAHATEDEPLLFVTSEVLHTRDAYTAAALERLADERGLHIGHTYLLNALPYLAGVFDATQTRLTPEWGRFVTALRALQEAGRIWNPTLAELAAHTQAAQQVVCQSVDATTLRIQNHSARTLPAFTVLLPRAVAPETIGWGAGRPIGWRVWEDWLAVWGALPPQSETIVRWADEDRDSDAILSA